jgi:hypothetical protein
VDADARFVEYAGTFLSILVPFALAGALQVALRKQSDALWLPREPAFALFVASGLIGLLAVFAGLQYQLADSETKGLLIDLIKFCLILTIFSFVFGVTFVAYKAIGGVGRLVPAALFALFQTGAITLIALPDGVVIVAIFAACIALAVGAAWMIDPGEGAA